MSTEYDAPLVQEFYKRIDKEIAVVEKDLLDGVNITNYDQYRARVRERQALFRAKGVMTKLISEIRKGEKDL